MADDRISRADISRAIRIASSASLGDAVLVLTEREAARMLGPGPHPPHVVVMKPGPPIEMERAKLMIDARPERRDWEQRQRPKHRKRRR